MTVFGSLLINGEPAPAGTVVQIVTPDGSVAGAAITDRAGKLGYTHVFGDPKGEGSSFQEGEPLTFWINGIPAEASVSLTWSNEELMY